jgi:predicted AAA+ superfamily ATPase
MTKQTEVGRPVQAKSDQRKSAGISNKAISKDSSHRAPGPHSAKQKKRKVFFNTTEGLEKKKEAYEQKLAGLQGKQNKRKRLNTLKIIMQINRALKNQEECVKDPQEEALRRKKDKLRRIAKKLEKKRVRELMQNVREEEKYGIRHSALQSK